MPQKIIADGPSNAVILLTGVLVANEALTPVFNPATFTGNDPRQNALRGFQIQKIEYSIGEQLQIQLQWQATAPQQIANLYGQGQLCFEEYGGHDPDMAAAGYDGAVNLITTGFTAGTQVYTILLAMKKLYVAF